MSQTVTASKVGVTLAEHQANALVHKPHDRSSNHGVTNADAQAAAILNTTTAAE